MATLTTGPQYVTSLPTINKTKCFESLYDQEYAICLTVVEQGTKDAVQLPCGHMHTGYVSLHGCPRSRTWTRHVLFEKPDDTVILNIYDDVHERIGFSRRLSDELTSLSWFCLGDRFVATIRSGSTTDNQGTSRCAFLKLSQFSG